MAKIKQLLQKLIPSFLINKYKKWRCYKIIENFDIQQESDLYIAESLVSPQSQFIDIGANIGVYTKYLSKFVGKVISIEPVPHTYSILEHVIARFNLTNVEPKQIAISNKVGETVITVPSVEGTINYYRASINNSVNQFDMKFEVQTETIDSLFLKTGDDISLIKCDVEGHELACIQGSIKFLENYKPAWLIEISGNPDEPKSSANQLFKIMESFGYLVWLFEKGKLRKREIGDESINYFFLQTFHSEKISEETSYI
jgi:FkbM family methyltransferase